MRLHVIDAVIILGYLLATVVIGLVLKNIAQKDKSSYLLGSNRLPWYLLGLSNASGMFDISGTMWLVTLLFIYGLKSIWIPWLWPVFNQVFLMVYLSMWLRRSNVTTGAEWIGTRFGFGRQGALSHNIVVVYALIGCLGFLAYGFVGLGKFVEIFLPWEIVQNYVPFAVAPEYVPHLYGIVFTLFAVFYAVLGGMVSIVWADLLQYIIMTISAIVIGVIAMNAISTHELVVPDGWKNPFFGWNLNIDWRGIIAEVNEKVVSDGYSLFTVFFMMMLFKGIMVSAAGPAPNYDMQKILATRSPVEASKMSAFVSVVLMPIRYFMIAGFGVLAILFYDRLDLRVAGILDFEQILPSSINEFVPVGFMGMLLAGLMAAFMSTFAGTLNAAQAYMINDIYLKYMKPKASNKEVSRANYITGISIVIISVVLGVFAEDVNSVLNWIVNALWGSYIASNVLKWYWWRFNGYGYFWGMVAGLLPALVFPIFIDNSMMIYFFPIIALISFAAAIIATIKSKPTDDKVLMDFYMTVKPWGFWKPVHDKVMKKYPDFEKNKNFKRDMFNIVIGTIAQTALVALPIYIVIKENVPVVITIVITIICGIILKKTWWDRLEEEGNYKPKHLSDDKEELVGAK
ncbi:MAG: sodium:solute symporter family protein [Candidatus Cyclobacteriaceae bacterium M3_2C_046]